MNNNRSMKYKKYWDELIERYGNLCFYCRQEIAVVIDHVVPYCWDFDNSIENLVPACSLCNSIANDRMFETVFQKQAYILRHREKYKNVRAICTNCLLPYSYRTHSPSLFLCAECYDKEYDTNYSDRKEWSTWIKELKAANVYIEAHREALRISGAISLENRKNFISVLIEAYSIILTENDLFYQSLCGTA